MSVDVIIRTLAEASRRTALLRAVESLTQAQGCAVRPIVVINGSRSDEDAVSAVERVPGVEMIRIAQAGLQRATVAGRLAVTAPYFAFLDDDDEYLPNGVDAMLEAIEAQPEGDAVVTNGFKVDCEGHRRAVIRNIEAVGRAPLAALRVSNWLHSGCGTIFRSSSFAAEFFDDFLLQQGGGLFEWTWIAYRACLSKTLYFSPATTYRINETPRSMSKSFEMVLFEDELLRHIEALPLPRPERRFIRRKHGTALHAISDECRRRGKSWQATMFHLRSMLKPGGWRYLTYTRHLLTQ